jgi:hypothetical protein
MTVYFAYGSNMQQSAMQARCPSARAIGPARLDNYKFFIGVDGWGSVKLSPGDAVHGVLWRCTPRDVAALHAYELLHKGRRNVLAMLYLLRRRAKGQPKPGYVEMIAASARGWKLPEPYIRSVERWSVSRWTGARVIDGGDIT